MLLSKMSQECSQMFQNDPETRLLLSVLANSLFESWQPNCTKKEIGFNIVLLATLNREKPHKKLKEIAWNPIKEKSNFTFSTLWNKYHDFLT